MIRRNPGEKRIGTALAGAVALVIAAAPLAAQGVDLHPEVRQLPRGYHDRVARDPEFFERARPWPAQPATRTLTPTMQQSTVAGTLTLLVVPALFADSPDPSVPASEMQQILFDGPSLIGTVSELYTEMSRGKLTVRGTVTPWVRTAITREETLGPYYGMGEDAQTGRYLVQALEAIDVVTDLGQFDNDGPDGIPNSGDDDGVIDVAAFHFTEVDASCGGNGIWPHRGRLSGWEPESGLFRSRTTTPGGQPLRVDDYIIMSAVGCHGSPLGPNVIAHELGHVFGLPDLYHAVEGLLPSQRRWLLGCWALMGAGAWGCGDGAAFSTTKRPTHMGAFEKMRLGWADLVVPESVHDQEYVLPAAQTTGRVLMVPLGEREFLLLEYRPAVGFDQELPASGVLIYHLNGWVSRFPASASDPAIYPISLIERDGDGALLRTATQGGNRGVAGDAWGAAGVRAFSSITSPALLRHDGGPSTVTFHSITVKGDVARVRLSTAAEPAIVEGGDPPAASVTSAWTHSARAAGGALPYTWEMDGLPPGIESRSAGEAIVLEGTPTQFGVFTLSATVTDALGTSIQQPLRLVVWPVPMDPARLAARFIGSGGAQTTAQEESFLDEVANRNGRYDIGDLRRYLSSAAPASGQRRPVPREPRP